MQNGTHKGIVGFVFKNKVSLILILILYSLVNQNIFINDFPNVIFQKQKIIEDMKLTNKQLQNDNKQLQEQIDGYTEEDLSLIESQARFKYGLVKDGEEFYQINAVVETDNIAESSESTL